MEATAQLLRALNQPVVHLVDPQVYEPYNPHLNEHNLIAAPPMSVVLSRTIIDNEESRDWVYPPQALSEEGLGERVMLRVGFEYVHARFKCDDGWPHSTIQRWWAKLCRDTSEDISLGAVQTWSEAGWTHVWFVDRLKELESLVDSYKKRKGIE